MREDVRAWRPAVPGITEVFHARFVDHAYPSHTHEAWTLLIVDDGAVRYDLDRHEHGALPASVTLLPPHVAHDGRSARPGGFRKRVVYLDDAVLRAPDGPALAGRAVDRPAFDDPLLRRRVDQLHRVLDAPGEELAAQTRLALIAERLAAHLGEVPAVSGRDPTLAHRLRDLLDARTPRGLGLDEAARVLHAHPTHLVRAFGAEFGLPPHRYLTGRRVDLARRLVLGGMPAADVATAAGFHDQAHLTRHFRRVTGTTPGRFARR
ncbi:AraC family transcriptional regulator [Actinomycetospora sp. NBRC 106375]|uniref:AraC family transcriptional regulator n=1 Tax=Actinomycetospora sp. NBRC 106375 TaxID=3032207 RepID=UPI0024A2149F|nr:AraC family transcriptional regulator [Actinomycetospora sp. NBRC 106375]GLZ45156.1 AraC family transcriptional regulator [Actinomycetospora sp. NBRC 106375]